MSMQWGAKTSLVTATGGAGYEAFGRKVWYTRSDGTTLFVSRSDDEGQTWGAEVTVGTGSNDPLDQPLVCDKVSGKLHALYCRTIDDVANPPVLCYRASTDDGATWSAEQILDDGTSHGTNHFYRVALAAYNDIVNIFWTVSDNASFVTDGLFTSRSSDAGVTFAPRKRLYGQIPSQNPIRPFAMVEAGRVHLTWYDTAAAGGNMGGNVYYVRSDDNGATWPASVSVLDGHGDCGRPMISLDNGDVNIVFMAPFGNAIASDIYQVRSTDNGDTWTPRVLVARHTDATSGYSHPWIEQWGKYALLLWSDVAVPALSAKESTDGGLTWGATTTLWTSTSAPGTADAPSAVITTNFVIAFGQDTGSARVYARNGAMSFTPGSSATLDDFVRADTGPPAGPNWTLWRGVAGEGDVTIGNAAARKATGAFRQGDKYTAATWAGTVEFWATLKVTAALAVNDSANVYLFDGAAVASFTGYVGVVKNNGTNWLVIIDRYAAGAYQSTPIAFTLSAAPTSNDQVLWRRNGGFLEVFYKVSGGSWQLVATAKDSNFTGTATLALEFTNTQTLQVDDISGGTITAPTNSVAPSVSGGLSVVTTMSVSNGTWALGPIRYSYQWQSSADGATGWADISGATLPWYRSRSADVTRYLRCNVTATNSVGGTTVASAAVGPIVLSPTNSFQ